MSLDAEMRERVLYEWNRTEVHYRDAAPLHELLEARVRESPSYVCAKYEKRELTRTELNRRANQVARRLRSRGIGPGSIVAVCIDRSFELLYAIMGVLKTGATYCPLDPKLPRERLAFMRDDVQSDVILASRHSADALLGLGGDVIVVDEQDWAFASESGEDLHVRVDIQAVAYAIFTSGTTGKPKAATIPHAGIVNFLLWLQHKYVLTERDRVLQKTNISFDVAVWELFWPLITDALLVFARPRGEGDSKYLVQLMAEERITIVGFASSMLRRILDEPLIRQCSDLRWVNFGGDALTMALQAKFFATLPGCMLHDLYGPAEASIVTLYWECRPDSGFNFVPIGRPVANTKVYILDDDLQPVAIGAIGEIYLSGVQLATGYHNRPSLTKERFVKNPFESAYPYDRMYRTGDLGRYHSSGDIEFVGRRDRQVKIAGARVELGEVEAIAGREPCFEEVFVSAQPNINDELRLVLYYVRDVRDGEQAEVELAKDRLRASLPSHSFPSAFVELEKFSLTNNGKIDVERLPSPFSKRTPPDDTGIKEVETRLKALWYDVTGFEGVRVEDNLFYSGGTSLEFLNFLAGILKEYNVRLEVDAVMHSPTIQHIAALVLKAMRAQPMIS